ncbi:MAG: FecR family protein [Candidatus Cyclobacteriaceae bacterium M3_2C_046]
MKEELLKKFYKDQCTPEEVEQVRAWIIEGKHEEHTEKLLKKFWQRKNNPRSDDFIDYEGVWQRLITFIGADSPTKLISTPKSVYYKIAASVLIIGIASLAYFLLFDSYQVVSTQYGQIKNVTLPDGSIVKLNANTSLKYHSNFAEQTERVVWLDGEAFFDVKHQEDNRKFMVRTVNMNIEVVGTAFNVTQRKGRTKVILNSGRVKLDMSNSSNKAKELWMNPGELVEFDQKDQVITKKKIDPEILTSWRNNVLHFREKTLQEISVLIEENFGKKVLFDNKDLAKLTFTGSNPADDLELLLKTLALSFDLKIVQENNEIIISE